MATLTAGLRRLGWGIADQAMSNLTNLVGLVLIARYSDPASFGALAAAFVVITIALSVGRGVWGESLLIKCRAQPSQARDVIATALLGSLLLGASIGLLMVLIGLIAPGTFAGALTVAGLGMPVLVIQDVGRYALFARHRADLAFLSDLAWLVASVGLLFVVGAWLEMETPWLLAAWIGGALCGALVVVWSSRSHWGSPDVRAWLGSEWQMWLPLTGDIVGNAGFRGLALGGVIASVGFVDGGGFRAASVVMGPLTVLTMAAAPLFLSTLPDQTHGAVMRQVRTSGLLLGAASTIWLLIALAIPDWLGEALLGAVWEAAEPLILSVGAYHLAAALSLSPFLALRGLGRTGLALRLRLVSGGALVPAALAGAAWGGAPGAAWSMTGVEAATLCAGVLILRPQREDETFDTRPSGGPE